MGKQQIDNLSNVFYALSDPTRRAILTRLVDGEASVSELMAPFQRKRQAFPTY